MNVDLNLATRPFVNRTPQLLLLGLLVALAGGLTAWNAGSFLRSRAAQRSVKAQLAELATERAALEARRRSAESRLAKADLKPLTLRAAAANSVLAQKAVSWTLLLERLEEILPWQAALRDVKTVVTAKTVKLNLTIRAKTYDDALAFIDSLEASPCFAGVYPHSDFDPKEAKGDFEMIIEAEHDPFCGVMPSDGSGRAIRLGMGTRGSRG